MLLRPNYWVCPKYSFAGGPTTLQQYTTRYSGPVLTKDGTDAVVEGVTMPLVSFVFDTAAGSDLYVI